MENLIKCSKILYDHDLASKATEIESLKKELQKYKTPTVRCQCETQWEIMIERSLQHIRSELYATMEEEEEYESMETDGLTSRQLYLLEQKLKDELYVLTDNRIWSEQAGIQMITNVSMSIKTLQDCDYWSLIYGLSTKQEISNYMYCLIEKIYRSVVQKLVVYCCSDCELITNTAFEDVEETMYCTDCAEKHGVELWV